MPLGGCCRVVRSRARSTRLCASCRHRRRCGWYRRSHVALHTRSVQCVRGSVCLQSSPLVMVAGQLLSSVSVWMDRKNLFSVQLLFAASHAMFCGYCGHLGPRPLARPTPRGLTSHRSERSTAPAHKPSPAAVETRAVAVEPQPERKHRHVGGKWFAMSEFVEKFGMDSLTSCKCSTQNAPQNEADGCDAAHTHPADRVR